MTKEQMKQVAADRLSAAILACESQIMEHVLNQRTDQDQGIEEFVGQAIEMLESEQAIRLLLEEEDDKKGTESQNERQKPRIYTTIYTTTDHVKDVVDGIAKLHERLGDVETDRWETEDCAGCGASLDENKEYAWPVVFDGPICDQCEERSHGK